MTAECTIQLFAEHRWHDVGSVSMFGEQNLGWKARTYTGYAVDWAVAHRGARDAHAFSCQYPVGLAPAEQAHWPVFLIDMLPQGFGREELLRRLDLSPTAGIEADWRLLLAGAGNPIGNLRVKEAAQWLDTHAGELRGFTDEEVATRGEHFTEYLARHGLFVAGSSGVQGEWPKLLLTRADDGLLYLDHTLPDEQARQHYIVKFGRGADRQLAAIMRHEAPYMELARMLGLRVHGPLHLRGRALFIPRFDRVVETDGVTRLAQESVATLTGIPGFGAVPSHDEVCSQLLLRCTHPEKDVLEYIKRDIANLALGNKDNHARNTAIQRDFRGNIGLTPLYDFAPMYLHPDGIARRIRWEGNDDGDPDWGRVIDRIGELARQVVAPPKRGKRAPSTSTPAPSRDSLVQGLKAMAPALRRIAAEGVSMGMDDDVHAYLLPSIEKQAMRLENLR
ncbi:type II toxin-antitoxin system HipA family toxin [Noviherbaspirillum galbum]|uniref:Type II toxin-antitoxin system HipA family toxin n=1 Tax=Noviherbaspirillum galbum TaxID=2709383 RepID=A0A6B3SVJ8_9BURK|nr:HipA domain-containing protein [Noviherbaspirillum galbum]NEX64843.1 type II toxin-antitoxin system HipA family toxin [Noviherbaspirillum galbum]